ncbi:MAG: UDP-N-acetylmuramoyl-tripeptide--D-alanyl-D-alanine ligase [Aquificae bacterium]|nr:UDP-N-acetylmuramoyl-tripeptide--D-alanyl-D-alanine ligase [Aquificota bacterium]
MDTLTLARVTSGKLIGPNLPVSSFSVDTRTLKPGQVFVALKGERFDGHDFIKEAYEKGAPAVISQKPFSPPEGRSLVLVSSTLEALRKIAAYKRSLFKGVVIGVGGSAGKTTTKELLAFLLEEKGKVFKTPGNLNSQVGLPLSIANAPLEADFWVLEMGASRLGEIRRLVEVARPRVRVLTALGEEHLEGFGSFEGVVRANGELFEFMKEEDAAVMPKEAERFYGVKRRALFGPGTPYWPSGVVTGLEGSRFRFRGVCFEAGVPGEGFLRSCMASFAALELLGFRAEEFKERLKGFRGVEGRMRVIKMRNFTVVDDCYNANPLSFENLLKTAAAVGGKKVFIVGDMLELGSYSRARHEELGEKLTALAPELVVFYGKEVRYAYERFKGKAVYCEREEELAEALSRSGQELKDAVIFIKGSRGVRLERAVELLGGIDDGLSRRDLSS